MTEWRLRVLMAERNINNKTLAAMTGLDPSTISRLKQTDKINQISMEALGSLCKALDCTPNDLFGYSRNYRWVEDSASNDQPSSDSMPIYALG